MPIDEDDIEQYYATYGRLVFSRCLRIGGGNVAWAEDVTHDVFVRFLEQRERLDASKNVRGWLLTVAYHRCLDRARRDRSIWPRVRAALRAMVSTQSETTPEQRLQLDEELQAVASTLEQLPPLERVVLVMRQLEGMSQQEIAATLNLSKGYVSKLVHRAIARIRAAGWEFHDA